jgi:hypothetical protein
MKKLQILLFFSFYQITLYAQVLSEKDLINKKIFTSKKEADISPKEVYRLALQDYSVHYDGFYLKKFPNCQVLDLSVSKDVKMIPFGITKMKNLQYVNLNNTQVEVVFMDLKKMKNLKIVSIINSEVRPTDIQQLQKKGIRVISKLEDLPEILKTPNQNSQQVTTAQNNSNNSTSSNTQVISPVNNTLSIDFSTAKKDQDGKWIFNPNNIKIDDKKSWEVIENGKKVYYRRIEQHVIINEKGEPVGLINAFDQSVSFNSPFSNGLFPFEDRKSKKFGYINTKGEVVIAASFDKANSFTNGYAVVEKDQQTHYINKAGKIIFSGDFTETVPFHHQEYAVIKFKNDANHSIINIQGKIISKNSWKEKEVKKESDIIIREMFQSGLILSSVGSGINERFGYKNLQGNWVLQPIYYSASDFTGGLATVSKNLATQNQNKKLVYGCMNAKGEFVLALKYEKLSEPWYNTENGEITIVGEIKDEGFFMYNVSGKVIFGPYKELGDKDNKIIRLTPFKNNYAIIEYTSKKIAPDRHFSEINSFCALIDRKGNTVLKDFPYVIFTPVNEHGIFAFRNYDPGVMLLLTEGEKDIEKEKIKQKNGIARISGEILENVHGGLTVSETIKAYGQFYSIITRSSPKDLFQIKNAGNYFDFSVEQENDWKNISIKYNSRGILLSDLKEYNFRTIHSNSNSIVSFSRPLGDGKFECGLYDLTLKKVIYKGTSDSYPSIGIFNDNHVILNRAGYLIGKYEF